MLIPIKLVLAASIILAGLNAQASTADFSVTGDVDEPVGTITPNGFNLGLGDNIFAIGSFDNTGVTNSGPEDFSLTALTLTVGDATFDISDDTNGSGFPQINFVDGLFVGINFDAVYNVFGFFNSAGDTGVFNGDDGNFGNISGHWDATTYVPIPAALWLFGSGLIGLASIARRKKS